ncbi:MAG: NUDIX domain-containing protein [Polyangiaceae bacterium]|nr:NUDIX domain-containing protein [Polyangiaceae bacterium]
MRAMKSVSYSIPPIGVLVDGLGGAREILLIQPGGGTDGWDIPSGAAREGESPEEAARRILLEQTGIEAGQLWPVLRGSAGGGRLLFEAPDASGPARAGRWFAPGDLPANFVSAEVKEIAHRWVGARWGVGLRLLGHRTIRVGEADLVTGFGPPWEPGGLPRGTTPEHGRWAIEPDEIAGLAVSGIIRENDAAALWFDEWVEGDQLVLFAARTVPPHHNDINCLWEGSGHFDPPEDPESRCTVSGLGGWYEDLVGVEQYPAGTRSVSALAPLAPGRIYYIASGRCGGSDFTFVDGVLATQVDDAAVKHRRARSRVAVSTWNSHIHYLRAWVYRIPPAAPVEHARLS